MRKIIASRDKGMSEGEFGIFTGCTTRLHTLQKHVTWRNRPLALREVSTVEIKSGIHGRVARNESISRSL